jgi:PAB1-binding protein PBP1
LQFFFSLLLTIFCKFFLRFDVGNTDIYYGNLEEADLNWDQFELNKKKFNVESSYDEKHYTTELIHSKIPEKLKVKAEKIVKEIIENTKENDNIHLKEERGLVSQTENDEEDEEDKYSSVLRNVKN